jgi:YceI-like domain
VVLPVITAKEPNYFVRKVWCFLNCPEQRRQVQERMLGPDVLDSTRFPEIMFESTHVSQDSAAKIRIDGQLSLRRVTKPVSLVAGLNGHYKGRAVLKQRDFAERVTRLTPSRRSYESSADLYFVPSPSSFASDCIHFSM